MEGSWFPYARSTFSSGSGWPRYQRGALTKALWACLIDGSPNDSVWCCVGWEGDNACGEEFWEGRVGFVGVGRPRWWSARVPMGEQHPPMGRRPPSPTQSHQRRETKDLRRLLINFVSCFMICTYILYHQSTQSSTSPPIPSYFVKASACFDRHWEEEGDPEEQQHQSATLYTICTVGSGWHPDLRNRM